MKIGGTDKYQLLTEVPVMESQVQVDFKDSISSFYNIVLEAPYNILNKWIVLDRSK